ncbi:MAG: NAD-dependent epimerase/dehydratase family protein [Xanthobacteraceae bacterium]|uniref:NAD-dependent epimerase/dehydratase family protein n=1 Tax=Pseudolabrys sp. TaxID=1960880 RepID=UPI003D11F248
MKVFLAGAAGAIGRRLTPLLLRSGHHVTGTTRSKDRAKDLNTMGAVPVVVDAFDAAALCRAVTEAKPDVVIHQLTDLPAAPGTPGYADGQERNRRIRIEGTRNLVDAAQAAGVRRVIAQSIGFVYAPAPGARSEADPLVTTDDPVRARTLEGVRALESAVLETPGIEGVVLRFGFFYGPGTWNEQRPNGAAIHVDAAAHATLLAMTGGKPGLYNIAEDDPGLSSAKAKADFGFDPAFRL